LHRKQIAEKNPIGLHKAYNSVFNTYLKSKCDVEKQIFLKRSINNFTMSLFDKYITDIEKYKFQIFGLLLATLTPKKRILLEKDLILETKRLNDLLKILGYKKLEDLKIKTNLNTDDIKGKFIRCYKSFNSKQKGNLACDVINIFSNKEIKDISDFEKIIAY
jgi:hypothetical protein